MAIPGWAQSTEYRRMCPEMGHTGLGQLGTLRPKTNLRRRAAALRTLAPLAGAPPSMPAPSGPSVVPAAAPWMTANMNSSMRRSASMPSPSKLRLGLGLSPMPAASAFGQSGSGFNHHRPSAFGQTLSKKQLFHDDGTGVAGTLRPIPPVQDPGRPHGKQSRRPPPRAMPPRAAPGRTYAPVGHAAAAAAAAAAEAEVERRGSIPMLPSIASAASPPRKAFRNDDGELLEMDDDGDWEQARVDDVFGGSGPLNLVD